MHGGDPSVYQKGTCGKNSTSAFALLLDLFLVKRSFHLRLNFGVVGKKRGDILFKDLTVDVVLRDLNDQGEERQNTDKVRDHHQPVEGIRKIPGKATLHNSTRNDHRDKDEAIDLHALRAEEVFDRLRAVLRPAENRGKGEEEHRDRHEPGAGGAEVFTKRGRNQRIAVDARHGRTGGKIDIAGRKNDDRRHGANDHGIEEDLKDAPHTLLDRLFDVRGRVNHDRRAKTRLVRENAALEALRHRLFDENADPTAKEGGRRKGKLEDRNEHRANLADVDANDDERAEDVNDSHDRNNDLGKAGNTLQPADDNEGADDKQENAKQQVDDIDIGAGDHAEAGVLEEGGVHVKNDLIDLRHVSDTEGSKDGKAREEDRQDLRGRRKPLLAVALAKPVAQIIHRATRPLAVLVAAAVVDAEQVFREVGHHSEEGGEPHPENRAGATRYDRGGNARDISRADRGGKGGAKRMELRDALFVGLLGAFAVLFKDTGDGLLPPMPDVPHLKDLGEHGQQNAGTDEKDEAGKTPYRAVDGVVDVCDAIDKLFHNFLQRNIK